MDNALRILVVDDEASYCEVLAMILQDAGHRVRQCTKSTEAPDLIRAETFDLVISDLIMPDMDGVALLREAKSHSPGLFFIIMTAFGTIENAVEAMRLGAFTYIIKGSDPRQLLEEVGRIGRLKRTRDGDAEAETPQEPYLMSTKNPGYRQILQMAKKSAASGTSVLIFGESGVGKEVLARYIHRESKRRAHTFLPVNCHTFADNLLESELFGHEKGAFTGATGSRIGRFEAAGKGTLFLDEIGDMPPATQAKLLRTLETKTLSRIGSNDELTVDFRLISATNKNIEEEIQKGSFREDLFYRISTIMLHVPPLRERPEDISALIGHFLKKAQATLELGEVTMDPAIMEFLLEYRYPGNIRELRNIIERLLVLSDNGLIRADALPVYMGKDAPGALDELFEKRYSLRELRAEVESRYIKKLLRKNRENTAETARELGISVRHLLNKMSDYHVREEAPQEAPERER